MELQHALIERHASYGETLDPEADDAAAGGQTEQRDDPIAPLHGISVDEEGAVSAPSSLPSPELRSWVGVCAAVDVGVPEVCGTVARRRRRATVPQTSGTPTSTAAHTPTQLRNSGEGSEEGADTAPSSSTLIPWSGAIGSSRCSVWPPAAASSASGSNVSP